MWFKFKMSNKKYKTERQEHKREVGGKKQWCHSLYLLYTILS